MKKLFVTLFAVCMLCFALIGCGQTGDEPEKILENIAVEVTANKTNAVYSSDEPVVLTADLSAESKGKLSGKAVIFSYQWYCGNEPVAGGAGTSFPAALSRYETEESGIYKVLFSAQYGEESVKDLASNVVAVTISKAQPSEDGLAGITAEYGQTLADVVLPLGWRFKDDLSTSVGVVGANKFDVVYAENKNYLSAEKEISITVQKIRPDSSVLTDLVAEYGQTLADVILPDGWVFKDELSTSVGNAGEHEFDVSYPADDIHFGAESKVTVRVAKVEPDVGTIEDQSVPYTFENTLDDIVLPTETLGTWAWKDASADVPLAFGKNEFDAVFTPNDTENYNTITQKVVVNVVYNTEDLRLRFKEENAVNITVTPNDDFSLKAWGNRLETNFETAASNPYELVSLKKNGRPIAFSGIDKIIVASGEYYEMVVSVRAKDVEKSISQYILVKADDCKIVTFDENPLEVAPSGNYIVNGKDNQDTAATRTIVDLRNGNRAFSFVPKDARLNLNWPTSLPAGKYDIRINFRFAAGLTRIFISTDDKYAAVKDGQDINFSVVTTQETTGSLILHDQEVIAANGRNFYAFYLWCQSTGAVYVESIEFCDVSTLPLKTSTFANYEEGKAPPENNIINGGSTAGTRTVKRLADGTRVFSFQPTESFNLNCNWVAQGVPAGKYDIRINFRFAAGLTRVFIATDGNYSAVKDGQDINYSAGPTTVETNGSLTLFSVQLGSANARYAFFLFCNTTGEVYVESIDFISADIG